MKKLFLLLGLIVAFSCSVDTLDATVDATERRPQVECGVSVIPDSINRQDIVDRLNSTGQISNGFSETQVTITYEKTNKRIVFGRLWDGGVQYNFTLSNEDGAVENGCITVTSNYSTFYDTNLRHGVYTVTFDDYPEVTNNHGFEVTRGR